MFAEDSKTILGETETISFLRPANIAWKETMLTETCVNSSRKHLQSLRMARHGKQRRRLQASHPSWNRHVRLRFHYLDPAIPQCRRFVSSRARRPRVSPQVGRIWAQLTAEQVDHLGSHNDLGEFYFQVWQVTRPRRRRRSPVATLDLGPMDVGRVVRNTSKIVKVSHSLHANSIVAILRQLGRTGI